MATPQTKFPTFSPDYLRAQSRWIRDELDPQVARDGPDALHSDDILRLDDFLRCLQDSDFDIRDIRFSRIHLAILDICGRATRWPTRIILRCNQLQTAWEAKYGPLKKIGMLLYEPGGRLHDICKPEDVSKEKLMMKWIRAKHVKALVSLRFGDLGFKPGDWWISPIFAFRDGIIDRSDAEGGIVADSHAAYAILMTKDSEVSASDPENFVYRARKNDPGRYRLTSGTPESRHPVRILRAHTLRSFYAPKAGVRYDGLYVLDVFAESQHS